MKNMETFAQSAPTKEGTSTERTVRNNFSLALNDFHLNFGHEGSPHEEETFILV